MSSRLASEPERFITFDCENSHCVGVVSAASHAAALSAISVVLVVGGPRSRGGRQRRVAHLAIALGRAAAPDWTFTNCTRADMGG